MVLRIKWFAAILVLGTSIVFAQNKSQIGFHPEGQKRVFFSEDFGSKSFKVLNENGKAVYEGITSQAKEWPHSGTKVCIADFSHLKDEGSFELLIEGSKQHEAILITNIVYKDLNKALSKSFYHARVSVEILEEFAGEYARPAGHPDDKVIIHPTAATKERSEGSTISSPGGWYDAGDYNKYIVNSSITTYTMLHAVQMYPKTAKKMHLNIPESGNSTPDLLDETLINLKWMLSMQDPNDGGVYHKLTSKKFCGIKMPHKDLSDRYVVMKTTAATLDFAATMAKAVRVLKAHQKDYPGLAEECEKAALYAWEWAMANPDVLYKQAEDIKTGQYQDTKIADEWFWAASELYLLSSNEKFLDKMDYKSTHFGVPQWGRVNSLGLYSILSSKKSKADNKTASKKLLAQADKLVNEYENSAYGISITKFPWGSNSEVANQGILLLQAYHLTEKAIYLKAADACAAYILGANPLGYCFITGFGTKSPMHIHERRSESDGIDAPVPGLLAGGPTKQARKDCGEKKYPSEFPAMSYLDEECSYSTNEIAINWNAAAIYLFLGLDSIYNDKQ
ncbi:glycoside hydrolase family 9 protein [Carboxylicivirga sp. N1Y90]|uniref:glycoside hydrolase family 9 protein n=1 Tax=Carboxylicivirga fragile TaxID=3417571 RepID=UPI003D3555B4|nr:glycoside hydrolase family 9 protein [Marinilabiliaceae bacterium N1Y90]